MQSWSSVWLEFYIHATALVSVLNQNQKTVVEIWAFSFPLSFLHKDSEKQHQLYLIIYINKLQNWIQGSERSAETTPLKHRDSCCSGYSGGTPEFWSWYSCIEGGRSPRMQGWLAEMGVALWLSFMRISEGMGRTWRRREDVFQGGHSKGKMERLSFCGLEPTEMVQGGIWGYWDKRHHRSAILKWERLLECH